MRFCSNVRFRLLKKEKYFDLNIQKKQDKFSMIFFCLLLKIINLNS